MKRTLTLILALVVCLSLCACGGKAQAFDNSKKAFDHVTTAYLTTNEFSQDIYEAWFQGVNNRKNYDQDAELDDFADEMNIELEYIQQATANLLGKESYSDGDWAKLPYRYNNSYFSAWVSAISEAYKCSGKADIIERELNEAKGLMKQLSDDFSDYEHYPALKKYFTNTLAFFDFCCNPVGSFEQVKDTFNTYRNDARTYFFDLNYVFGDSIGGMDEYTAAGGEATGDTTGDTAEPTAPAIG